MTWGALMALPEEQQRTFWRSLTDRWQHNAERELDADLEFDRRDDRIWWE